MHVCRSAAAAEREQWRHREVQSSGCCSHGTARGREGKGRVSYRIGYSNLGFGQGRGRDLIPRSACLGSPPSPPLLFGPKMFRQVSHFLPPSSSLRSTPASLRCLCPCCLFPTQTPRASLSPSRSFKRWIRMPRPHLATPKRCSRSKNKDCDMFAHTCSHTKWHGWLCKGTQFSCWFISL